MQFYPETGELKFLPEEIMIINTETRIPSFDYTGITNYRVKSWKDFMAVLSLAMGQSKAKDEKTQKTIDSKKLIFVDSFTRLIYWLSKELKAQGIRGHDFWREFGDILESVLMEKKPTDKFLVYTSLDEVISDNDTIDRKVASAPGRLKGNVESHFDVVLSTSFNHTKSHPECYQFETNKTTEKSPSKSPVGMFDSRFIQNNLAYVLGKVYQYRGMKDEITDPDMIMLLGKSGSGKSTSLSYVVDRNKKESKKQ